MNIQAFRSQLSKGEKDFTKPIVFVANNKEYEVEQVISTSDRVQVMLKEKEVEVSAVDSIENTKERAAAEKAEDISETEETKED